MKGNWRLGNPNSDLQGGRPGPAEIWRTWLISGSRAYPIDRRRLLGAHRGLKQALAESGEIEPQRRPWRDFSRAMHRQSVSEAMGRLTARERVVLTMAYFAGFTNSEIAVELGMTTRGVQRSLRRALDRLSDVMERGRRIALGMFAALLGGRLARWVADNSSAVGTPAVAAAAVAGVIAIAPATPPATPAPTPAQPSAAGAPAPVRASAALQVSRAGTRNHVAVPPALQVKVPNVPLPALKIPPPLKKILPPL